jgi:hypothetical protein
MNGLVGYRVLRLQAMVRVTVGDLTNLKLFWLSATALTVLSDDLKL